MSAQRGAYYNEIDPFAAAWLRELIAQNLIAPGDVDERSIVDVRPDDLRGYTQCHFFAGIGVWSYALRNAGWPDDRPVWTGSCPCQPFSAAGKGGGFDDERHLWPFWHYLIEQCRPATVFGEQVASKYGLAWFDLVQADLEGAGYAAGAVDLCAAGVGAPHIRQRLWFVADTTCGGQPGRSGAFGFDGQEALHDCGFGGLANADNTRLEGRLGAKKSSDKLTVGTRSLECGLADTIGERCDEGRNGNYGRDDGSELTANGTDDRTGPTNGFWRKADWLFCRNGKWRAVEPGTFPLAHGASARVGRLRGYGNAIAAPAAQEIISAYMDIVDGARL